MFPFVVQTIRDKTMLYNDSFPSLCLEDQIPICFKIKFKNNAKVAANRSLIFSVNNDVVNFRGNRQ